ARAWDSRGRRAQPKALLSTTSYACSPRLSSRAAPVSSVPQRANSVVGGVLQSASDLLCRTDPGIVAVGHAQPDAQIPGRGRRCAVTYPAAFDQPQRVLTRVDLVHRSVGELPLQAAVRGAPGARAVHERQQCGEVPATIEIVVVVPADVISGVLVAEHRERALIPHRSGDDPCASNDRYPALQSAALIEPA